MSVFQLRVLLGLKMTLYGIRWFLEEIEVTQTVTLLESV